jgi:pimeloyl-ACP methyl ester carboxylesterase
VRQYGRNVGPGIGSPLPSKVEIVDVDVFTTCLAVFLPHYQLTVSKAFVDMVRIGRPTWMAAIRELGWAEWQANVPLSNLGTNKDVKNTNDIGGGSGPAYDKWHRQQQKKHPTEGMALYAAFIQTVDVRDILEEVKVPTLLVAPTQSFASPRELNEEIARRIPDCKLEWVDGLGHMTWIDKPQEVTNIVLKFVDEIVSRK